MFRSAVETKHAKKNAGTKPNTQEATVLLIDKRKSTRPTMKRKTDRGSTVSTARDDLNGPNMYAYLCSVPRCRGISRNCRDGGSAEMMMVVTMARLSTKLRNHGALILMADAEGLCGPFPWKTTFGQ